MGMFRMRWTEGDFMDINKALQIKEIDYIKQTWGKEVMIQVYGQEKNDEHDCFIRSYLIPLESVPKELNQSGRANIVHKPGYVCSNDNYIYKRFASVDEVEPIIVEREYNGLADAEVEVVEEFRLAFNLYHDRKNSCLYDLENDCRVITIDEDCIKVDQKYLRIFLALKNKALVLFEDNKIFFDDEQIYSDISKSNRTSLEEVGSDYRIKLSVCDARKYSVDYKFFSMLYGKAIAFPCSLEGSGIWPYDGEKRYVEFKIGRDSNCKDLYYTCNPEKLGNFLVNNPNIPDYLTPVFFRKEVLDKYRKDDRYSLEKGILRFGTIWALYIDNERDDDLVSAYLGDLGRDLPSYEEQQHWASCNVVCEAKISDTKFQRDMMAKYCNPVDTLSVFQSKYVEVNRESLNVLGWSLYLELSEKDAYIFKDLYVPSKNSQSDFDNAVLLLTKLLCDALNVVDIKAELIRLNPNLQTESKGSIFYLSELFKAKCLSNYDDAITALKNIQELRSSGTGHLKGKNYDKICKKLGFDKLDKSSAYRKLLGMGYEYLCYLENNINNLK